MTLPVGTRVARRGDTATVAYVGALPPHEGDWYGLVWDRIGRGQHDGVGPDGTRYFHWYATTTDTVRRAKARSCQCRLV